MRFWEFWIFQFFGSEIWNFKDLTRTEIGRQKKSETQNHGGIRFPPSYTLYKSVLITICAKVLFLNYLRPHLSLKNIISLKFQIFVDLEQDVDGSQRVDVGMSQNLRFFVRKKSLRSTNIFSTFFPSKPCENYFKMLFISQSGYERPWAFTSVQERPWASLSFMKTLFLITKSQNFRYFKIFRSRNTTLTKTLLNPYLAFLTKTLTLLNPYLAK